jgi:hypothetical protein
MMARPGQRHQSAAPGNAKASKLRNFGGFPAGQDRTIIAPWLWASFLLPLKLGCPLSTPPTAWWAFHFQEQM